MCLTRPAACPAAGRRGAAWLLAAVAVCCAACAAEDDVTGLWQMSEAGPVTSFPFDMGTFEGRMRMALGQYGKAVSGEILLYVGSYHKTALFDVCPCAYMDDSEVRSGRFTFSVNLCGEKLLGDFELVIGDERDTLEGTLSSDVAGKKPVSVVFERSGGEEAVAEEELDRGCP